eukprot:CAMPEP_0204903850 /NCGR_PEP_ID=MMETSP1397-20131031/4519_1 /ASSEMBLY_ACC=CAM_ASM_000891 /TAXON_ID=49980 /ORGANISM="Climacostomum Climacostomum virens, Strain Stock W-24" /LENGTH=158 /DNA_ID=CAMNT_0052072555 /DNA_START=211 /DNA_END=684 /DNA_ORIENTATION=+
MLRERANHAVTYHDNYLYSIGGYDSSFYLRDCERFDVTLEKWEAFEPLPRACFCSSVIALEEPRCLYALGGGIDLHGIDLIQRLKLDELRWDILELKLPDPSSYVACFKLDESQVYFVIDTNLYCFTPRANSIKSVKALSEVISSFNGPSYYSNGVLY